MKTDEVNKVFRESVVPQIEGDYAVQGDTVVRLCGKVPALCGYLAEPTPRGMYVWAFCQPLFLPYAEISLGFADRLGSIVGKFNFFFTDGDSTSELLKRINEEAEPILSRVDSLTDFMNLWDIGFFRENLRTLEAKCVALLLANDSPRFTDAKAELRKALRLYDGEDMPEWVLEIDKRREALEVAVEKGSERILIDEWIRYSTKRLPTPAVVVSTA